MARGKRQRKQASIDPSLIADFDLSLHDIPLPQEQFTAEQISSDKRRLRRDTVPIPSSTLLQVPQHPGGDPARVNQAVLSGVFQDEDPFFVAGGEEDARERGDLGITETEERALRYITSDEPMKVWIPRRDMYLGELLRLEGRAGYTHDKCRSCPEHATAGDATIRCKDCTPGPLVCASCAVQRHAQSPFHRVQRWDGQTFQATCLKELGLVVRLGHDIDSPPCPNPEQSRSDFTVIDVNGRHSVTVEFCGCDRAGEAGEPVQQLLRRKLYPATDINPNTAFTFSLLEHYHIQSLQGKISMYDYYTSLERLTDNTGVQKLRDRYKAFMRVVAQWRHLKRLKRAGRGHDPTGVEGTQPGELAVRCPACPRPNVNLPPNWDSVSDDLKFMYIMTIAIDACFRLKRRAISSEEKDPILGSGWGYLVEDEGFRAVLEGYLDQDEISTCTGLSAIDHANTKYSQGYAATGIGAIVCARHEFWLPQGAGDLQKGEKYINMDYIFCCAMREWLVLQKIVSYDIACQWSIHILERIRNLPSHIQIPVPQGSVMYVIPKLHFGSHERLGHSKFSLNYRVGCARTDGEGIERRWWWMQPIANSTKVMGPGMRQGMLEDQWGYSNWRKTVDLVWTLSSRLKEAVKEHREHQALFSVLTDNLRTEEWTQWESDVKAWEADPDNHDDPYVVISQGLTEGETLRELSQEEQLASSLPGFIAAHDVSLLGFVTLGLEIEANQMRLADDASSAPPSKLAELHERRTSLRRKIQKYRALQSTYMPAIVPVLAEDPSSRTDVQEVEKIRIGLPSEIGTSRRSVICSPRLLEIEGRLREAQCRDALQDLRNKLHTIHQLYHYKKLNVRNQGPSTRARAGIAHQDAGKTRAVRKYRRARQAKLSLSGPGAWESELQLLEDHHIRGIEDDDPRAVTQRKRKYGDKAGPAEGRRQLSWIWHSAGSQGSDSMIDSLRVEWLKARARKMRWGEEVQLLPEEMRRVLATFKYEYGLWQSRASMAPSADPILLEGLVSYAMKQAQIRSNMAGVFRRICLPLATAASSDSLTAWEVWEETNTAREIAAEEEDEDFRDYITMYHLEQEDLETL
ncbi:hypothetical protein FKP32DRAFT_1563686 [Trametes sanguinea]|nr:hypothetical protein FKP32DRAFT_1563686 [Trametes sanguinea]